MSELSVQRTPQLIAAEINNIKDQTRRMMLYNSIEIGRRLTEAKHLLDHGQWGEWLEKSVSYSKSTANNLMRIFDEYGSDQITLLTDNAKTEAFGRLSYSQAVALLGVPEEEREAFVEENDVENMSTRELQKAIQERDQALKEKEKVEKENVKLQITLESVRLEKESSEERISKLQIALMETDQKLKSALESGTKEEIEELQESMKTLDDELAEMKRKNEELQKQLKEQPIEAKAVVEKVDKAVDKFKLNFEIIKAGFNGLLQSLGEMEDKEKYQTAALKYLGILEGKLKGES